MKRMILSALVLAAVSAFSLDAQTAITLNEQADGKYMMDASINGVGVKTYYTDENWFASLSSTTYLFLYENGYIVDADVKGMTTVKMPSGASTKAASFVIRNLQIDNVIVQDLPAFVIAKQNVPLLVGNAAFDCFGTVTQQGRRLVIDYTGPTDVRTDNLDEADSLRIAVQECLDNEDYAAAEKCFEALYDMGELNMYSEYQYAMILNILGRSDKLISVAGKWLEENEGKAHTLDYWMYDHLGNAYALNKDTANAIAYYEKAVATYCGLFNATEKDIKKGNFKDESLGVTLYNLGRQHSAKNMGKAEYYFSLAAKCGNAAAIDFCKQFRIKY